MKIVTKSEGVAILTSDKIDFNQKLSQDTKKTIMS